MGKDGNIGLDVDKRPVRVPPSFAHYLEEKDVYGLLEGLMKSLLIEQPDDPLDWMINFLQKPKVPKIIVGGSPDTNTKDVADSIAQKSGAISVNAESLMDQAAEQDSDEGRDIKMLREQGLGLPSALKIEIVLNRLQQDDVAESGFVLSGFPSSRPEALALQMSGIIPSLYLLIERDLDTGGDAVSSEMELYKRCRPGLVQSYKSIIRKLDATLPTEDLHTEAWKVVCTKPFSNAPTIPRVVILGPPGAGCATQAARLAAKYDLVFVSMSFLITKALSGSKSKAARAFREALERVGGVGNEHAVADDVMLRLVTERLETLDSQTQGWVLEGFPMNAMQATLLAKGGNKPSRVYTMKLDDAKAMERVCSQRVHPITGRKLSVEEVPEGEERAQLLMDPNDSPDNVMRRLKQYTEHAEELKNHYSGPLLCELDTEVIGSEDDIFRQIDGHLVRPIRDHAHVVS
eukprot:m.13713 g.13713  ORF g.13713 m.13713 type:complete len:461 (-) comp4905_c0_seq2:106-1488(-)